MGVDLNLHTQAGPTPDDGFLISRLLDSDTFTEQDVKVAVLPIAPRDNMELRGLIELMKVGDPHWPFSTIGGNP